MKDPYSVLGVSPTMSVDEIKKVYRELVRKYHPDNYAGNDLADLADEKMKEINWAWEQICAQKDGRNNTNDWNGAPSSQGSGRYQAVRTALMNNNLEEAERLLEAISTREAEWFFLQGSLQYRKGWYDQARRNVQKAYSMDPHNNEYRRAAEHMQAGPNMYNTPGYGGYGSNCSCMDICCAFMCADCLCGGCR